MEDTRLCFVTVPCGSPCGVRLSMQTVCAAVDLRNVIIRHSSLGQAVFDGVDLRNYVFIFYVQYVAYY